MRSRSVQKYRKQVKPYSREKNSRTKKSSPVIRSRSRIRSIGDSIRNSHNSSFKFRNSNTNFTKKSTIKSSVFQRLYTKPEKKVLFSNSRSQIASKNEANRFLKKLKKDYESKLSLKIRIATCK